MMRELRDDDDDGGGGGGGTALCFLIGCTAGVVGVPPAYISAREVGSVKLARYWVGKMLRLHDYFEIGGLGAEYFGIINFRRYFFLQKSEKS